MNRTILSEWIYARLLAMKRPADPCVDARVARLIANALVAIPDNRIKAGLAQHIPYLPPQIVSAVLNHTTLAKRLDLHRSPRRELSGVIFIAIDYWQIVRMVMQGNAAQLESEDGRVFEVRLANRLGPYGDWPHLAFVHDNSIVYDTDWRIQMASEDEENVRSAVNGQRQRLELNDDEVNELVARLQSVSIPDRVSITDKMELALPLNFYITVRAGIATSGVFAATDLVPERLEGFPRRLGFVSGIETVDGASVELLRRIGLTEAIGRWCALPTMLPAPLVSALRNHQDPSAVIAPLIQTTKSPLSLLNQLFLASFLSDELQRTIGDGLLNHALDSIASGLLDLHLLVARWFANEFSRNLLFVAWPVHIRLAVVWFHTHEVMRLLINLEVPSDLIEQAFNPRPEHEEEALLAPVEQLRDIAHPQNIGARPLLLRSVAIAKHEGGLQISEAVTNALLRLLIKDSEGTVHWDNDLYVGAGCIDSLGTFSIDIAEALRVVVGADSSLPPYSIDALPKRFEDFIAIPTPDDATYIATRIGWLVDDAQIIELVLQALESPTISILRTIEIGPWHLLLVSLSRFAAFVGEPARQRARTAIVTKMNALVDFSQTDFAVAQSAFVYLARSADTETTLATYFADLKTLAGRDARSDLIARSITRSAKARLPARLVPKELSELELFLRLIV